MNRKIYFASDFHFGIPTPEESRIREDRFVRWLDTIHSDASEIYLLGDLFDFWFEYRTVIPKGYTRLLGKLAELTSAGIRIHLFRGNHDMWAFSYLAEEIGITLHREPEFRQIGNTSFYMAHGDGLGSGDRGYKIIKRVLACRFNHWLFRWFHPDLGIPLALFWSRRSRYKHLQKEEVEKNRNLGLIESRLLPHSEALLRDHPGLNYLIYGHYHLPYQKQLSDRSVMIVLGDWLTHFSYGEFDGNQFILREFER